MADEWVSAEEALRQAVDRMRSGEQVRIYGLTVAAAGPESLPEVECPACGATIRARMADAQPDPAMVRLRTIEFAAQRVVNTPTQHPNFPLRLQILINSLASDGTGPGDAL